MSTAATAFTAKVFNLFARLAPFGVFLLLLVGLNAPAIAQNPDPTRADQLLNTFTADSFQTDLFTGASTAQIPIQVPSAAAGLAPKIALRYVSSGIDEIKVSQQASGAGLGWALDTGGFIVRDMKETAGATDDIFKLIFGGGSYDLIKIDSTNQIYHTRDESFLKVQYFSTGDYWVVTTKNGLQHRFGFNTDSKQIGLTVDLKTAITWRYYLDEVKTTSGVSIRYAYSKITAHPKGSTKNYDQVVYLDWITYAYRNGVLVGPKREIHFIRALHDDWKDTTQGTIISLHEKERLDRIEVLQDGNLVSKYVFGFDNSIDRDPTDAYWSGGTVGDLTLKSVTFFGADGVSTLPSVTFTYKSFGLLETATNGLGGTVRYTYERIKNLYLNRLEVDGSCTSAQYLSYTTDGCISQPYGYLLKDPAPGTIPIYVQEVDNGDGNCGPGLVLSQNAVGCGTSRVFGYLWLTQTVDSIPIYLVKNDNGDGCNPQWVLSHSTFGVCSSKIYGYIRTGAVDYSRGDVVTTEHARGRVLSRTTSDGLGWSSTTNFISYNPSFGLMPDSTFQEFRGYGQVRAIDPLGHYTDTFFLHDDLKKGRTSRVEARSSAGALFSKLVNTWTTTTPYPKITAVFLSRTDKYKCDGDPTCIQTAQTFTYDSSGNPTQTTYLGDVSVTGDERTEKTDWSIDSVNWIHRPIHLTLLDAANAVVRERWLTYNTLGLLTKEENRLTGLQGNAGNPVVTYTYDVFGNRTSTTDALGCTTNNLYESSQTYPATVTTCLGHQTTFTYDTRFGVITSQTDPNLQTTTSEYDVFGRLTKKTGPLDGSSAYGSMSKFYLDFGNPNLQRVTTYTTEEHGTANVLVSEQYFDGLARADHARTDGPGGTTIVTDTTYDIRGKVEKKSAPYFLGTESPIWTRFDYDVVGRQIKVTHPDGTFATTSNLRDLTTQTDENGNVKGKYVDVYDRQRRLEEVNGAETYVTTYEYNVADSLTKVTNHLGHVTTMTYNIMGRKIAMSDPNMGNWTYSYDKAGNLISQTDAKGQTLTFTYDLQSRMTTKTYPNSSQIIWTYDDLAVPFSKGRLTKAADLSAVTCFSYDQLGRVTQTQRTIDGAVCDGTSYTMSQTYNALGKVTSETFPDGDSANYSYDAGALVAIPGYVDGITYNARGQKKTIQHSNGVTSDFQYNDTGAAPDFRLGNRVTSGLAGNFQNLTYDYDNVGNITSITDAIPGGTAGRTYTYDALNRLTSGSGTFGPGQSQVNRNYTYDAIGNIRSKDGVTYFYDDPNHPSFVTSTSDGKTYTADANGNTATGNGRTFNWTPDNRVASVTMGSTVYMDYDYTGIRVKKTNGSAVTTYPFSGYEIGPDGIISKFFKVGNEMLAAKKSTGEKLFYHNDHLGGINVITKLDGTRAELTEYEPWGKVGRNEPPDNSVDPSHRFTGQELDPETGLYYYGGRYYDAELGRFVSPDTIVPQPKDPQTLNRYSYALNNPVNRIDPTGHCSFIIIDCIIEGIVAIISAVTVENVIHGIMIGVTVASIQHQLLGGSWTNILIGGLGGGIAGAIGIPLFSAFGGGQIGAVGVTVGGNLAAAAGSGGVTGAIIGGLKTAISGGNFWLNVGLGALTGAITAAAFYGGYMLIHESLIAEQVGGTGGTSGDETQSDGNQDGSVRNVSHQRPGSCMNPTASCNALPPSQQEETMTITKDPSGAIVLKPAPATWGQLCQGAAFMCAVATLFSDSERLYNTCENIQMLCKGVFEPMDKLRAPGR